jgi:threonine dehydrogenase-like Zn-dependent dehydrogenase
MRGAVLHAPSEVRCEQRPDAIVRTMATCVCGSDLWPYRGIDQVTRARAIVTNSAGPWSRSGMTSP